MIVGTVALLTILFFGGVNEAFLIDKLEKGVKEYVVEKEKQKDILADLKTTKKFIETFNKGRKSQFKKFIKLYKSPTTSNEDLQIFFDGLRKERLEFQDKIIDYRLTNLNKIEADEWKSIIENSKTTINEKIEKEEKKAGKNNNEPVFEKTRNSIKSNISDLNKQKALIDGLDNMLNSAEGLQEKINSINVKENNILIKKEASKEELKMVLEEMNKLRNQSFTQLLTFRNLVKENSNDVEWEIIMKAFTKELSISTR